MKKYIFILMAALGILTLASCSENEPMAYEGQPALFLRMMTSISRSSMQKMTWIEVLSISRYMRWGRFPM